MKIKYAAISIVLLFLGLFFRYFSIDSKGIWGDEKISISNATGVHVNTLYDLGGSENKIIFSRDDLWNRNTPENVVTNALANSGGNAILYNLFLHYWIKWYGTHDKSVRLLSLIFGFLLLPFAIWFGYKVTNRNLLITLFYLVLLSFNFLLIRYSQETRAYSMGVFFCFLSTVILYQLLNGKVARFRLILLSFLYSFLLIMSLFTHFLTVGFFIGHVFYLFIFLKNRRIWRYLVLCSIISFVFVGYYFATIGKDGIEILLNQSNEYSEEAIQGTHKQGYGLPANAYSISAGVAQVTLQVSGVGLQNLGVQIRYLIPFVIMLFVIVFFAYSYLMEKKEGYKFYFLTFPFLGQIFLSIILAVISGHNIPFLVYYFIFSVPLIMLIIGMGIYNISLRIRKEVFLKKKITMMFFLSAYLFVFFVSLLPIYFEKLSSSKERLVNPYLKIADKINRIDNSSVKIVYGKPHDAVITNFYLKKGLPNQQIIIKRYLNDQISLIYPGNDTVVVFDFSGKELRY